MCLENLNILARTISMKHYFNHVATNVLVFFLYHRYNFCKYNLQFLDPVPETQARRFILKIMLYFSG